MDQLGGLVRERFGNWIKRATLQMEPVTNSALSFNSIRVVSHQILDEAVLVMGHSGPSRDSPDHLALTAASLLLGGAGPESRLEGAFKSQGIPYRSLTAESQFGKSCGRFQVLARIPVSFLQQAIQLVLKEIEGLKADPVTEPELNLVKSRLLDRHKEDLSSDAGLANGIAEVELYELSRDFLSVFRSRVERLSPERVQESAKNHLSSTRIAVIIVGDREKTASGLTGFRSIEILEEPDAMPPANSK
jgi:predicted Zn-dependent peptidase